MKKLYFCLFLLLPSCVYFEDKVEEPPELRYIELALDHLGLEERRDRKYLTSFMKVNPVYTEWCAAFVNTILENSGYESTKSLDMSYPLVARSYLMYDSGVLEQELQYGDIMVFRRGNSHWQGHVGFYMGRETIKGKTYYRILGGNQDDQVSIALYPANKLLGIRRPLHQGA